VKINTNTNISEFEQFVNDLKSKIETPN